MKDGLLINFGSYMFPINQLRLHRLLHRVTADLQYVRRYAVDVFCSSGVYASAEAVFAEIHPEIPRGGLIWEGEAPAEPEKR